jgi:hypothetical protein
MNLKTVDGIASPRKADLITNSNVLHFNSPHQSCYHSVLVMGCVSHIFSWLSRLNLFLKPNKGDQSSCLHQEELQRQLHATRSYLILLIILLIALLLSNALTKQTVSFTVKSPSLEEYLSLEAKYASTLVCPCRFISVQHSDFLSFKAVYHPVSLSFICF